MKKESVMFLVVALIGCMIAAVYPQTTMLKGPNYPGNENFEIKGYGVYYAMPYEEFGTGGGVITLWNILTGSSGAPQWW